ncbi:hypothetical protein BDY21DRAFT_375923 [Lineolata rhizophorae]|uniref:F-box domain-containing protein n=1 Tax=Lineolata rhizophorae TaxID=578093 RepID=A0A6A6PDK2_9PEZI|nr:hypothetical protein BDY21DRAFT_375923 [Lineolata rhizophorae]
MFLPRSLLIPLWKLMKALQSHRLRAGTAARNRRYIESLDVDLGASLVALNDYLESAPASAHSEASFAEIAKFKPDAKHRVWQQVERVAKTVKEHSIYRRDAFIPTFEYLYKAALRGQHYSYAGIPKKGVPIDPQLVHRALPRLDEALGTRLLQRLDDAREENVKPFPFLSFPADIRHLIYDLVLGRNAVIYLPEYAWPRLTRGLTIGLLRANRQVHAEASAALYSTNTLLLRIAHPSLDLGALSAATALGPYNRALLRKLEVQFCELRRPRPHMLGWEDGDRSEQDTVIEDVRWFKTSMVNKRERFRSLKELMPGLEQCTLHFSEHFFQALERSDSNLAVKEYIRDWLPMIPWEDARWDLEAQNEEVKEAVKELVGSRFKTGKSDYWKQRKRRIEWEKNEKRNEEGL